VPSGDRFTPAQRATLASALDSASASSGLAFRLYVGALSDGRASAERLLAERGAEAAETVLIAVDPASRGLEIVTGSVAALAVDDRTCALAALTMTSSFAAGDLVGGLRNGLQMLGDHARPVLRRHLDTV
jgi:hypothetical protein